MMTAEQVVRKVDERAALDHGIDFFRVQLSLAEWQVLRSHIEWRVVTDELIEKAARAIFIAHHPSNMCNADWDSRAILGENNSYRDTVVRQARAALQAALGVGK